MNKWWQDLGEQKSPSAIPTAEAREVGKRPRTNSVTFFSSRFAPPFRGAVVIAFLFLPSGAPPHPLQVWWGMV